MKNNQLPTSKITFLQNLYILGFHYDNELHNLPLFSIVPQFVYIEGALYDSLLSFIRGSPIMRSIISFEFDHDCGLLVPLNNEGFFFAQSPYLNHVSVTLGRIPDCVRLLNQLGSQLHSFNVRIVHVYQGDDDITSEIKSVSYIFLYSRFRLINFI